MQSTIPWSKTPTQTVSIIGTANRTSQPFDAAMYEKMIEQAMGHITGELGLSPSDVILKTGGAACGDSVAVSCFLRYPFRGLILCLPARWEGNKYALTAYGRRSNELHEDFTQRTGIDGLVELRRAIEGRRQAGLPPQKAKVEVYSGFFARNAKVAQCSHLIAFTFSPTDTPDDGGTKRTWDQCTTDRKHFTIVPSKSTQE